MKIFFSYILLFVLAFRPMYNIGYVAYFELNIDYIVETYCVNKEKPKLQCNGKCHLVNKLAITTNKGVTDNNLYGSFFEAFFPVYFQDTTLHLKLKSYTTPIKHNWSYCILFSQPFGNIVNPPPQFV